MRLWVALITVDVHVYSSSPRTSPVGLLHSLVIVNQTDQDLTDQEMGRHLSPQLRLCERIS